MRERRKELLNQIEKLERELAELERDYALARNLEKRRATSAKMGLVSNILNPARKEFESITQKLRLGHKELDDVRGFVNILDQEIERKGRKAA